MKSTAPDGHLPTLIACFAHFDVCFMLWVLVGALGRFIFGSGIDAGSRADCRSPHLTGSLLRIPPVLSDRCGRRVGRALLLFSLPLSQSAGGAGHVAADNHRLMLGAAESSSRSSCR